jgi:hypothetical protein
MADPELKGEHFHKNNPDMKLDFSTVSEADIAAMEAKKTVRGFPITHNESIDAPGNETQQQFMASDGSGRIGPRETPTSVAWLEKVRMVGQEEDLPEP